MATTTFSSLPAEIIIIIAEHCEKNDLLNLCRTSKRMNERCLCVLYRHVHLKPDRTIVRFMMRKEHYQIEDASKTQRQFFQTLLSHPEYGKYVRSLKVMLCVPTFEGSNFVRDDMILDGGAWRAIQSLTQVRKVEIGSVYQLVQLMDRPTKQIPDDLFQSATAVRLIGHMQYRLAKSILNAINPAMLKHLCLDMVQDHKVAKHQNEYVLGDVVEDGRVIARGATSGLLTTLTGRCTALQTLALSREGQIQYDNDWHADAEEASYVEWASFIRSVQGTVKKFRFEHLGVGNPPIDMRFFGDGRQLRIMDERFQRLVLPAIVSGNWPFLSHIRLRGVRNARDGHGKAMLKRELRAVLGEKVKIFLNK